MQEKLRREPADIVLEARTLVGESQRTFAARMKTKQSLICKYETGQVAPPSGLVIQCMNLLDARVTGVSTEDLIAMVKQHLGGSRMRRAREAVAHVIACVGVIPIDKR